SRRTRRASAASQPQYARRRPCSSLALVLAQAHAHAFAGEHAQELRDLGVAGEQRELLLVDLLDFGDGRARFFRDRFLGSLVILILRARERVSRRGHRQTSAGISNFDLDFSVHRCRGLATRAVINERAKQPTCNDPPRVREVKPVLSRSFPPLLWI